MDYQDWDVFKQDWRFWLFPHHIYLGAFMIIYGALVNITHPQTGCLIFVGGLLIFADDLYEHTIGLGKSPIRDLYLKFHERIP